MARIDLRERLIRRVAKSICWASVDQFRREAARRDAVAVVDDLLSGSAEGKATERALRIIRAADEESA